MTRMLLMLTTLGLVAAACGGGEETALTTPAPQATECAVDSTDPPIEAPEVPIPDTDPPAELVVTDLREGTGTEAETGCGVEVHYIGVAWSSGESFDASWERGETFPLTLGIGRVIPGWDQGLVGMRVGGQRRLEIPPHLAYGEMGAPPAIGPNETLVFVVDLVAVGEPEPGF